MSSPRVALVVAALVVVVPIGGLAAGVGTDGALAPGTDGAPAAATTPRSAAGNATTATPTAGATNASELSFGERLSSFMQSSAAHADGSVETGMWVAAYRNASSNADRAALVRGQLARMNATIAELRAEKRALKRAYRNGSIDRSVYRARLGRIVGRLAALEATMDAVGPRARAVGVNATRLQRLRANASALGGREVAAIARGLAGGNRTAGPPWLGDNRTGPPPGAGPPGDDGTNEGAGRSDGRDRRGNGTAGNESAGNDGPGGSDRGDGRGDRAGNTTGTGSGSDDDAGNGSDDAGAAGTDAVRLPVGPRPAAPLP